MADFKVVTPDYVTLQISTSSDDSMSFNEKRFSKDLTIADVKAKLELITGGNCATMQIEAYNKANKFVCGFNDDTALLGSYPLEHGMRLHIIDKFMRNDLEFGNVEKYEMPSETYAARSDTLHAFLVRNKTGLYDENYMQKKQKQQEQEEKLTELMVIGSRCKVSLPTAPTRLGTVLYAGPVEGLAGQWIGVKYDEPLGKNDGTFKEKEYFKCPPNYGAFVKPQNVLCGDFPEETYDFDAEI